MTDNETEIVLDAALEIVDCMRVLKKSGMDLVKEVLQGQEFVQWTHYPQKGGVFDPESHSQFYFHAHAPEREEWADYGHFHTFLRVPGMPDGVASVDVGVGDLPEEQVLPFAHLIGISLDNTGSPVRLFTVNRWVTAETWYTADDVIAMLDHFEMDIATPSWPLCRWLSAMIVLYRDEIEQLVRTRDEAIAAWAMSHPNGNVYEDRDLAITSVLEIDLDKRLAQVSQAAGLS